MNPRLSVVLPVLNEMRFLPGTLGALLDQDVEPGAVELLVVDGGSSDGTREWAFELAKREPRLRLLDNPLARSSAGRNVGWRAARGVGVLFVDGHVHVPRRDLLRETLRAFEAGHRVLARAQPLDPPDLTPFQRAVAAARASFLGHQGASEIYREATGEVDPSSSGAGYLRSVLESLGGYDENFDAAEDVEFNARARRAGILAFTSPAFTLRYYPRESLGALWRQCRRYGQGRARLWRKHPDTLGWSVPLPSLYFTGALAQVCIALLLPVAWVYLGMYLSPYLLAILVASLGSIRAAGSLQGACALPAIFACIHSGFATGFLGELLSRAEAPSTRA